MIISETVVKFSYDREDRVRIQNAINVLEEVTDAFQKAGGHTETEKGLLTGAAHVLDEILRYETF